MTGLDLPPALHHELAALGHRFVCWRWETREGKPTKPPLRAFGGYASTTDPTTWCSLDTALAAARDKQLPGIGLVLAATEDGTAGIDLDGCRDPDTGTITPAA